MKAACHLPRQPSVAWAWPALPTSTPISVPSRPAQEGTQQERQTTHMHSLPESGGGVAGGRPQWELGSPGPAADCRARKLPRPVTGFFNQHIPRAADSGRRTGGRGPCLQHPLCPLCPPTSTGPLRFRGRSRATARSSGTVSKPRRCSLPAPTVDPILSGTPEWVRYPQTRFWGPRWTPGHSPPRRAQHHLLCPGSCTQGGPAGPSGSQPPSLPGRER